MVLGGTVRELKSRMTHKEWCGWLDFFNRNGRASPMRRWDFGNARVSQVMAGGTLADHMMYRPEAPAEQTSSIKDLLKEFGGVNRGPR